MPEIPFRPDAKPSQATGYDHLFVKPPTDTPIYEQTKEATGIDPQAPVVEAPAEPASYDHLFKPPTTAEQVKNDQDAQQQVVQGQADRQDFSDRVDAMLKPDDTSAK